MKSAPKIALACLFLALPPFAGCDGDGSHDPSSPLQGTEYASEHYVVRVVGRRLDERTQEQTRQAALLMEQMFAAYSGLIELPLPPGDRMPIWLHLSRGEYDRQAALHDYPAKATTGFCNLDGEVHVYFRKIGGDLGPESTMMHEGFHQYCHRALHLPTPPDVHRRVPGYGRGKLPTVPLWLNEGMAMNMETGRVATDHNGIAVAIDDIGSVNKDRLYLLARLIRENRCPSVRGLMNKIMGDQLTTDDYAAMWGVVFDLRMATGNAIYVREQRELERAGPDAVRRAVAAATDPARSHPYLRWPVPLAGRLLRASSVAWGLDVPSTIEVCVVGAREPRDFERQWNRAITRAALEEMERLFRDQGQTLEEWEQGWRLRMLTLYAEVRGGAYKYEEAGGAKRKGGARGKAKTGVWN